MKNLNLYILGVIAILFSACSTNQDLAKLNEYDDVYYQGSRAVVASVAPAAVNDNTLNDASDAERSYYQNAPYTESETENQDNAYSTDSDYYDEDYSNRIDNFHRPNSGDYMYSNSQNTSPAMNYSLGYGMGNYGSGFNMGFSYGSPAYGMGYNTFNMGYGSPYMSPWYSPYYSPYYSRPYYGYGYGGYHSPFYDPYYPSYGYGGYGGGYYGGYYPPYYGGGVGGDYYGSSSGVVSTPRENSGSVRPSRGGVINPNTTSGGGRSEIMTTPSSPNATQGSTRSTNEINRSTVVERSGQAELRGKDVQTREEVNREVRTQPTQIGNRNTTNYENTRPGTTRNDYIRAQQPTRQTPGAAPSRSATPNNGSMRLPNQAVTPNRTQDTRPLAPATRSRSGNVGSEMNRQPSGTMTQPSRGRSSSPSYQQRNASPRQSAPTTPNRSYSSPAPSQNSGGSFGGGGSGTSSPASTPSRGSRR